MQFPNITYPQLNQSLLNSSVMSKLNEYPHLPLIRQVVIIVLVLALIFAVVRTARFGLKTLFYAIAIAILSYFIGYLL